ncbi:MAG: DNA repair protein RadA [Candidatus Aminicenantia bacterium]
MKTSFICQECGYESPKWLGKCPACSSWNSFIEYHPKKREFALSENQPVLYDKIDADKWERIKTGISEFDRCMGGGIIKGSITLVGGEPGIGKSTLILQISQALDEKGFKVLYVSGEESPAQIKVRGERIGIKAKNLFILSETIWEQIEETVHSVKPDFLICDSIQTIYSGNLDYLPGSTAQVREVTSKIFNIAKREGITSFIIGHITKEGIIAGPKSLEHIVDAVLYFEGERFQSHRILRAVKNRFGALSEVGIFEMEERGLIPVQNPSNLFLSELAGKETGVSIYCGFQGTRPILIEIQTLVTPTVYLGSPRRTTIGLDPVRTSMLIAITEKRLGFSFAGEDVFVNVAGGIYIDDPSSDLSLIASLISSKRNNPIPPGTVFFGEVGLAGEVRPARDSEARINEAESLGFRKVVLPEKNLPKKRNFEIEIEGISHLKGIYKVLKL